MDALTVGPPEIIFPKILLASALAQNDTIHCCTQTLSMGHGHAKPFFVLCTFFPSFSPTVLRVNATNHEDSEHRMLCLIVNEEYPQQAMLTWFGAITRQV